MLMRIKRGLAEPSVSIWEKSAKVSAPHITAHLPTKTDAPTTVYSPSEKGSGSEVAQVRYNAGKYSNV